MKKWYFSKNGEISGPMDLTSARKVVGKSSDIYGWHPSFITWKPVSIISEFSDLIKNNKMVNQVPKEIINEFHDKKLTLVEKLTLVTENIKETELLKASLKKKISIYKQLTENLNDDFQSAIISIEQQYSAFTKRLLQLQDAAQIAKEEIDKLTEDFQQLINSKEIDADAIITKADDVTFSPENKMSEDKDLNEIVDESAIDFDLVDEAVPLVKDVESQQTAQEPTETVSVKPVKKRMVIDTKETGVVRQPIKISTQEHSDRKITSPEFEPKQSAEVIEKGITSESNANKDSQNNEVVASKITSIGNTDTSTSKSLSGVKNIFKSVFKSNEPAPKLSTQLKASKANTETEEVIASKVDEPGNVITLEKSVNESDNNIVEDEGDKATRTRRRRRRR